MEVYKFLWWKGRANMESVLQHFSKNVMEDLDWLLKEKKISVHREPLGDLWIRCPAYVKKDPILELITLEPGITPTEAIERLGMTRKDFYQRLKKLDVERVVEGRNTKLYIREQETVEPVTPVPLPPEQREDRSEPLEEPEDLFEGLDGEALIVARGVQEGKWAISEPGCVVLGIDPKKFNWNKGGSFSSGNMNDKVYHALYYYTESRELYELEHFVNIPLNEDWRGHWEFSDEIADWFTDGEFEWSDVEDTGMPEKVAGEAMKYLLINGVIKATGEGSWR